MSSGKQYKNVYTILEKVKKGEIPTHYKNDDGSGGLFGKLHFYKRPDIVKPYMHYIDERKLENIVGAQFTDSTTKMIQDEYGKFVKTREFAKLPEDKKPDYNAFHEKLKENYKKFPGHLKNDVYKMYYNRIENLEFEERDSKNHAKFKFLERANNPVGKIMAESSNLKSSIFTRNMMMYYLLRMTQMDYVDAEQSEKIKNGIAGDGDSDDPGTDDAMQKMFDNKQSQDMLDRMLDDAQKTCKMMDDSIDQDIQEKMFDEAYSGGGNQAGKLSPDYIRQVAANLANIRLSMGSLKEKLQKILDKSASYFSARKITTHEDLFNADSIAGLEDYELLHPKLRKVFMEDVMIKETKNVGKIDIYVDISGSMSSHCGSKDINGKPISKLDFAKSMIAKLKELDMLNDIYLFDTRLKKSKDDLISISMIDSGGGTTIDVAVASVEKNNVNALILTDAEDHCSIYSSKAFFIGVEGANFRSFNADVVRKYTDRNQLIVFDGTTILGVDSKGYTIQPNGKTKR